MEGDWYAEIYWYRDKARVIRINDIHSGTVQGAYDKVTGHIKEFQRKDGWSIRRVELRPVACVPLADLQEAVRLT